VSFVPYFIDVAWQLAGVDCKIAQKLPEEITAKNTTARMRIQERDALKLADTRDLAFTDT
jgi:hypothetical protein